LKSEKFVKVAFALIVAILLALSLDIAPIRETAKNIRDTINPYFPLGPLFTIKDPGLIPFPSKNGAVIFIHDVAPEYETYIEQITSVIDRYNFQKYTYLFVITFHHGRYNIENYPGFVSFLKRLQKEGYHIEFHAYLHNGAEFQCPYETAIEKMEISWGIFERCGLGRFDLFFPPHGKISKGAIKAFLQSGISVITKRVLLVPENSTVKAFSIDNQEYSWYINSKELPRKIAKAKRNYELAQKEKELFCLSLHPKAVNNSAGIEFLKAMLIFLNRG